MISRSGWLALGVISLLASASGFQISSCPALVPANTASGLEVGMSLTTSSGDALTLTASGATTLPPALATGTIVVYVTP
ncbi:hypothetical protein HaLaN_28787, partial [Haematococcus lacustris]